MGEPLTTPLSDEDKKRIVEIAGGALTPADGFEKHFLLVVKGLNRPHSERERAWLRYWLQHRQGPSFEATPTVSKDSSSPARLVLPVQTAADTPPETPTGAVEALRGLQDELLHAVRQCEPGELGVWAIETAATFGSAATRRVELLARLAGHAGAGAWKELCAACDAAYEGRLRPYVVDAVDRASETAEEVAHAAAGTLRQLQQLYQSDPQLGATRTLGIVLGGLAGSGGVDGNGGAPDLDLMMGIDAHRSVLTHSIIAGVVIETSTLSLISLVRTVHGKLPQPHDAFWDNLLAHADQLANAFSRGASAGIAYHLFVDSIFQPAAYHDLPAPAPLEVHQALMAANAATEGADAVTRPSPVALKMAPRSEAGKAVDSAIAAASEAITYATDFVRELWEGETRRPVSAKGSRKQRRRRRTRTT